MHRKTWVEVDLDKIANNISTLISSGHAQYTIGVVKANAYGHGALAISDVALQRGVDVLAVATLDEALELRTVYSAVPILVLGVLVPTSLEIAANHNISVTAHDLAWLKSVAGSIKSKLRIHLKLDTGMSRLGFTKRSEVNDAAKILDTNDNLVPEGIYTHFAKGDCALSVAKQISKFEFLTKDIVLSNYKYVHLASSSSLGLNPQFANTVRLGLAMYGLTSPNAIENVRVSPAFEVFSEVTQVKCLKEGTYVGYDHSYQLKEPSFVATIPIGYADGLLRHNQGRHVKINQKKYKIIGSICMDQCMVLVDKTIKVGDRVTVLGDDVSISSVAKKLSTIPYEIVCNISYRVPRVYR